MKHVISLGAGVQSSTMALMAAHSEITPMPDFAVFADTGWEPKAVYEWLDWLEQQLPFPVARVGNGNLRSDQITARMRGKKQDGERWASLPYFVRGKGVDGLIRRQCTSEYKIQPIIKHLRGEIGLKPRQHSPKQPVITQWIGISLDEAQRMKPSRERWITHRWPLIERRMSRQDCLTWMETNGYMRPPRSSCIGCPFHSDAEWRDMRDNRPDEWADAVEFDDAVRDAGGMRGQTFLHRQCVPLDQADLTTAEDHGQVDMFGNECEGMCGV